MLKQADIANDDVWRLILDVDNAIDGETLPPYRGPLGCRRCVIPRMT